jgi:hypothetical protein
MKGCNCFDELPASLLAEEFPTSASYHTDPERIILSFTCPIHGATRGHVVYPHAHEWEWAYTLAVPQRAA